MNNNMQPLAMYSTSTKQAHNLRWRLDRVIVQLDTKVDDDGDGEQAGQHDGTHAILVCTHVRNTSQLTPQHTHMARDPFCGSYQLS